MARKAKATVEGKFLIVSHGDPGYRVYAGAFDGKDQSLTLPPAQEVAADKRWLDIPAFARDVQQKVLDIRNDDIVPMPSPVRVDEKYNLDPTQRGIAERIALTEWPFPNYLVEAVRIYDLLGPGGITPDNVKVTRDYCKIEHRLMLMAARDLENGHARPRPPVIDLLNTAIREIEAL